VREVDVNVAEVALQPAARRMIQRHVRLALTLAMLRHETPHLVVPAGVTPLLAQPREDPHRRVTLLARRRLVLLRDRRDRRLKRRRQLRAGPRRRLHVARRRRVEQGLADRVTPAPQPAGNLPRRQAVAMKQPDL